MDLTKTLRLHRLWLTADPAGKRADLGGAHLQGAYLKGADLRGAHLGGADLRGAHLGGADLRWAHLQGAYLTGAYLRWADLRGAHLGGADLRWAHLQGAYLTGAYLQGADLGGAHLGGAYLTGAYLGCGWSWEDYAGAFTALLCTGGGAAIADVAAAWGCHEWANCPMHVAYGIEDPAEAPETHREAIETWVWLFDASLIPVPVPA